MVWSELVVFFIAVMCCDSAFTSKVVLIDQGPVRGYLNQEKGVYEFYGIPYALAPTKENKYQAPLPPKTWSNTTVFDAIDGGIVCLQGGSPDVNLEDKIMQEDCLIANIFTPQTEERNLSVLVYIHEGGFQVGYGTFKQFTALVKMSNIIVVSFNYRLGIIGNLCLGTETIPGNAGIKDQIALLRWVNRNIAQFGGDPDKVTIAGCSSGAANVEILGISKTSKGLFRNMIVNSGSCLDVFALQLDPKENADYFAKKNKLYNKYQAKNLLENLYKSLPNKLLISDVFDNLKHSGLVFSPCVERNDSKNSVLTDAPFRILENQEYTQTPILYTYTEMEGLIKAYLYDRWKDEILESFSEFLPADLKFQNDEEKETLAKIVKDYYFTDVPGKSESISYVKYFTDIMFVNGILKAVELRTRGGQNNVYLLEYSYVNERSPLIPNTSLRGANHCSQVLAVADEDDTDLTQEYKTVKNILREIWTNFIKTSNPKPKDQPPWPAGSPTLTPVMVLGKDLNLKIALDKFGLNTSFYLWDNIYKKYYRFPVPPIN